MMHAHLATQEGIPVCTDSMQEDIPSRPQFWQHAGAAPVIILCIDSNGMVIACVLQLQAFSMS